MDCHVIIRGRRWRLKSAKLINDLGSCDPPETRGKTIKISDALDGCELLEVLLHELTHAAAFDLAESTVNETARDIAAILWRLGYRREH